MARSPLRARSLPTVWQAALIGTLASLPVAVIVNRTPGSAATLGGSIMLVGALVAGAVAAGRGAAPAAAGSRAGLVGAVVEVVAFAATQAAAALAGGTAAWPLSRLAFFGLAAAVVLCLAPVFGSACGRVGGWVANRVRSRSGAGASAP
ncbi:DUF5518 domain-containing protein [Haloglomus litoreum]|uniref:DUF5518 domain-containing protein n=1 Tax=Haloglomus litoreum TaxID=3034026 RepID=UPI0023E7FABB|nr:DUF5518 domain-containing protein [Haloglomus sp. DT116]